MDEENGQAVHVVRRVDDNQILYRLLTSPRVFTILKWAAISGVSVGVCAVALHYIRSQNDALRDGLKDMITDAVTSAIETMERPSQIIEVKIDPISTLCRISIENGKISLENAPLKSIEQVILPQMMSEAAIEATMKTGDSGTSLGTSIEKQIGEGVTWVTGKVVGVVRGYLGR